ncbi:MAG: TetR/AcrR family transcriptional regulator [Acutalibacteraceae bacterium]
MQVKKEEIREKILEAATEEFFKKGYENASMRVIAQKSYTTLGNIYHYYPTKEILLKAVLLPTVEAIEAVLSEHIETEIGGSLTKHEALEYIENFDKNLEQSGFTCLLDKKVVILIKLQSSDLLERKEKILQAVKAHLNEHLNISGDNRYSDILLNMFVECVKYILIEYDDYDEARAEFIKFFRIFCYGMVGLMK